MNAPSDEELSVDVVFLNDRGFNTDRSLSFWPAQRTRQRLDRAHTYRPAPGELSQTQCEHLASALINKSFIYEELDLRRSSLKASGAELLFAALDSSYYSLEALRLSDCVLTERCLTSLVSALTSGRFYLKELDLNGNRHLMEAGVRLLSAGLRNRKCRLKILRLVCCKLTETSCAYLGSALERSIWLEELDLSGNRLQDAGVKLLTAGLKGPLCVLKAVRLRSCSLTEMSCGYVASVLMSRPLLKELDLSLNQLHDVGIKLLSDSLKSHNCKLRTLRLTSCAFSVQGCAALVSALTSRTSDLTELDVSGNQLQPEGMRLLSALVQSPACHLQTLRVSSGQNLITTERPVAGTSSNPSADMTTRDRKLAEHMTRNLHVFVPFVQQGDVNTRRRSSPWDTRRLIAPYESSLEQTVIKIHKVLPMLTQANPSHAAHGPNTTNRDPGPSECADAFKTDFTPEVSEIKPGETSYKFRVQHSGTYQCVLTRLVFTVTQPGRLSYRIIQWDQGLLQSAGKTPAGPLYSIQCSEDSVSQLHLPHCETQPALITGGLSVVHCSDDAMSFLEPLRITDTHVVVDVPHFSAFGLVWDLIEGFLNIHRPTKGQVLLFHRTRKNQTVNVFLLPENVPLMEVKGQQEEAAHIVTPSSCVLSKGRSYSLRCPEAYRVQPACSVFDINYGPNYHPAFEVRLSLNTEEAAVTVLDQERMPVWDYYAEFTGLSFASNSSLTAASSAMEPDSVHRQAEGSGPSGQNLPWPESVQGEEERKLLSVRSKVITAASTSVVNALLDNLLENRVINSREIESVQAMARADKTRELLDMVRRKGNTACKLLIDTLCELDPFLSETLQLKQE
ncbi:NACHT, LRR and PYD domains-containing protein 1-like isoform X2 [Betta splendens]|uniref:NACHT, LRR and PYD domains-containing protein 1-like isoform X2 n=1 Tax=Betta splendens TaxID=158456 RepID=A0A9W2XXT3_BETSP|nr:NACHT, LRR and PYD domains-containing protein 1-like isoform X2 [Betta splendens]